MNDVVRIFIIDDDMDDQVLMQQAFESTGIPVKVQFSTRSDEALQQLHAAADGERPDIIVSDYNMPMMNGEEFLQRLQTDPSYHTVPKVIVSTAASPSIIEACIGHGASKYLIKPSDFEELIKLARDIINLTKQ